MKQRGKRLLPNLHSPNLDGELPPNEESMTPAFDILRNWLHLQQPRKNARWLLTIQGLQQIFRYIEGLCFRFGTAKANVERLRTECRELGLFVSPLLDDGLEEEEMHPAMKRLRVDWAAGTTEYEDSEDDEDD